MYLFPPVDNGLAFLWDTAVAGSTIGMASPTLQIDTLTSDLDFCLELNLRIQDVQLDVLAGFSHYYPGEDIYIGSLIADPERSENFSMVFHNFSLADFVSEDTRLSSTSTELMLKFRYTVLEPGNPLLQFEHVALYEQNCNDPSKECRI